MSFQALFQLVNSHDGCRALAYVNGSLLVRSLYTGPDGRAGESYEWIDATRPAVLAWLGY